MGTDLTFIGGGWTGYDIPCSACGSGCRAIDRFCSQCGQPDPTGRFGDDMLTAPTIITHEDEFRASVPGLDILTPEPAPDNTIVLAEDDAPREQTRPGLRVSKAERSAKRAAAAATLERMLIPGNVFGRRYRIQRFLGAGAMGYVCSAVDDSIDEVIALKVLSAPVQDDPDAFERFRTELKLARKIRHRNVVQSFDLGFAEGYPYISMEYIDADNLQKHLQRRKVFEEKAALAIVRQVLRGLRAAHDLGIIHRDIKPENILLNKDEMAFITDFGIATTADRVKRREIAGTPDYMAPEQLRCEDVFPATDLYACGILLYRMVTGTLPFKATTMHDMIEAQLHQAPRPIADVEVSDATRTLIDWMLQKRIADRPQSVADVLDDITAALNRGRSRSASQRVTVLVADSDPHTLAFLRGVLETDGYRVFATTNAREAVDVAFEQSPAVIVLDTGIRGGFDMVLPDDDTTPGSVPLSGADGLAFLRIIRSDDKLSRVPIVVTSELAALQKPYSQSGAAEFLQKPLAPESVTAAVRRAHLSVIG
ncbi:MAG TPA: serine/threonine-protein kinase [Thermoanaerobaculia bacterium]|nr:serine/threonine-protein kinase [Thermoanaerobaculia bacterium]